jgi:hypothetical protein
MRLADRNPWKGHHWMNETDIENYRDERVSSLSAQEQGAASGKASRHGVFLGNPTRGA